MLGFISVHRITLYTLHKGLTSDHPLPRMEILLTGTFCSYSVLKRLRQNCDFQLYNGYMSKDSATTHANSSCQCPQYAIFTD